MICFFTDEQINYIVNMKLSPTNAYMITIRDNEKDSERFCVLNRYYIKDTVKYKNTYTEDMAATICEHEMDHQSYIEGNTIWLSGDQQVMQINDITGELVNTYDLAQITNTDSNLLHHYVWSDGKYMLIRVRGAFGIKDGNSLYPAIVNLSTGEVKWIYKDLIPEAEIFTYENKSMDDPGGLFFKNEQDGVLNFIYQTMTGEEINSQYRYR